MILNNNFVTPTAHSIAVQYGVFSAQKWENDEEVTFGGLKWDTHIVDVIKMK